MSNQRMHLVSSTCSLLSRKPSTFPVYHHTQLVNLHLPSPSTCVQMRNQCGSSKCSLLGHKPTMCPHSPRSIMAFCASYYGPPSPGTARVDTLSFLRAYLAILSSKRFQNSRREDTTSGSFGYLFPHIKHSATL